MRIGSESSEAADPFSETALEAISTFGTPPPRTVNRRPPQVRAGPKLSCASYLPSVCGTEGDALGHHAIADEVPQGDQELARQSNDHLLAQRGAFSVRARNQLAQGALLLEIEETPRELDHAFAHSNIARSGKHSRGVSCRSRRASLHSEPRRAGRASCVTAPP
jgi:hypothetical protein